MSGTTANEGYPYPVTSDFADVQDAYRLATAIDTDLRAQQDPFRQFMNRPSFIARQLSTRPAYQSGSDSIQVTAIDWDNTGGLILNNFGWIQPISQDPSWWLFGMTILVINTGTPVVGDLVEGQLGATTVDQVTGLSSTTYFYQRNDESGAGGEWLNSFGMAPIYRGQVGASLVLNGTTSKSIGAGSRFWGMYLGPVT